MKVKKISRWIYLVIGLGVSLYLILPCPRIPLPNLPESIKSDLPGDTVQIENVSAYFTNKDREEVISFYEKVFSTSRLFNLPLLTYRLNHPPEYAKDVWVDTQTSYYLEEVVHPLRESLFVNGFDWQNDVFTRPNKRVKNKLIYKDKVWDVKVSLRWFTSSWLTRLAIFWLSWSSLFLVFELFGEELKELGKLFKRKK